MTGPNHWVSSHPGDPTEHAHAHTAKPLSTHHTEQGPFVEGRMESDELSLGPWLPLDDATVARRGRGEAKGSGKFL